MDPVITLFFSLLVAHLLADFAMQSDEDIARKSEPVFFVKHIGTVTVLSWLLIGDWGNWVIPLVVAVTHGLLDAGKLLAQRHGWNNTHLFAWDQIGHLAVIFGLTLFHAQSETTVTFWQTQLGDIYPQILLVLAGLVISICFGGLMISMALSGFRKQLDEDGGCPAEGARLNPGAPRVGLIGGGKRIGQLERFLTFLFVLMGRFELVVLLLIAKTIFSLGVVYRYPRKVMDYVLVGTLTSFAWGLVVAWFTRYLLDSL